jgi:hypothetical protein
VLLIGKAKAKQQPRRRTPKPQSGLSSAAAFSELTGLPGDSAASDSLSHPRERRGSLPGWIVSAFRMALSRPATLS